MNKLVSIIVPSYNVEGYIDACMQSILGQTYSDLEVICIDDGSTDGTLAGLKKFELSDKRVRVFTFPNGGLSAARNRGIEKAQGDYIVFVDGDDTLPEDAVQVLFETIVQHPEAEAAVGSIKVFYESHFELKESDDCYYKINFSGSKLVTDELLNKFHSSSCAVLFKRKKILEAGLKYPEKLHYEDAYWHWCYFTCCKYIAFTKKNVYNYFRHPVSIMSQTFEQKGGMAIQHLYIADKIIEFWKMRNMLDARISTALMLIESFFGLAIRYCKPVEKGLVAYECSRLLERYSFNVENHKTLTKIRDGKLAFLYVGDECDLSQEDLSRFLQLRAFYDKLLPKGSLARGFVYKILRAVYKATLLMKNK